MISKNQIKLVKRLEQSKYRRIEGLFIAEGPKLVGELLAAKFIPKIIFATQEWTSPFYKVLIESKLINQINESELCNLSLQQHPNQVIGLFSQCERTLPNDLGKHSLVLALDGIQDPGNMGTICRIADWFGIEDIICSNNTVDVYNPKAIQATMGAIARIRIHYCNLPDYLVNALKQDIPVYGTFLKGENIYTTPLDSNGIIVMGNEGNGISSDVSRYVSKRVLIPNYPNGRITTESLNVAVATAITVSEFRRRG